ncbi:MAG: hypothetical protein ACXVBQ_17555 [Pseudobdellovibrionaceae bacterium]
MKILLLVMLESLVLTVFFTMISQADIRSFPTYNCCNKSLYLKKGEHFRTAPQGQFRK